MKKVKLTVEEDINAGASAKEIQVGNSRSQFSGNQNIGKIRGSMKAKKEVESLPSSPKRGGLEFHVFLSGEDYLKDFTRHVYDDLERDGISTFIHDKLEKGEQIVKVLEYVKRSKIFVPIFSKRYAQSAWCLKEVNESLECGMDIIPVFYDVEPSDVGKQSGPFQYAFKKHESNTELKQEDVAKWREALNKVGGRSGFNLKDMNGDVAKLKRKIVKLVSSKISNQNIGQIGGSKKVESLPSSSKRGESEFHVFLSFRGNDTRKGIARYLYDELEKQGISTFIDSEKLKKGEQIDKVLEYIKRSKICVPIFSKGYAESKWCLKEITESLKCGMDIIPVFYDVEPFEVSHQRGPYQYAFKEHESNTELKQDDVVKWREALNKVGVRSGFNLKDMNGNEAKLKRKIVKLISAKINNQNIGEIGRSREVKTLPSSPKRGRLEFHIFLSFSGEDTGKGFTRHLYDDLENHDISTFMKSEKLKKGEPSEKVLEYIKRSKFFIPIFSKSYAKSIWCLKEITESLNCGMDIIPVFYDVKPSDVCQQTGSFQYPFQLHESNRYLKQEEVAKWREALNKVGGLSGFTLRDVNGDEVKLKHKIVNLVSAKISNQNIGEIGGSGEVESLPSSPERDRLEFHVFLSFIGRDIGKGFVGHLYDELEKQGISTFKDSEKLKMVKRFDKLLEYIKRSKIFIPIFSKNYAHSKWCLKEVTESLECRMDIIPVFYGMETSDVRKQWGPFECAFQLHESNTELKQEEVAKWREALKKVGGLSGFTLRDVNGDEAKLKRKIVKLVSTKISKVRCIIARHSNGLKTRIQDVKNILEYGCNRNHPVRVVGIHGIEGIGKTTIAEAVYNDLAPQGFDGATCFLSDIREQSGRHKGLVKLQKQFFVEVFKEKDILISSVAHGQSLIKERANGRKVLLILDDIDSVEQINALAGGRDWFGSGSVIIITTRNKDVLVAHDLKEEEIYKLQGLNEAQSLELFIRHAFDGEQPQGKYVQLTKQVVAVAGGLPLTLKVLGSLLFTIKDVEEWKDILEKLKKVPPKEVKQILKISYDNLHYCEKQIFLDISCFFIGRYRQNATYMWEGCGWNPTMAIGKLEQRFLIKIDENSGEFEMHDQIRDMGREIVAKESSRQLKKQSRIWNREDSLDLLRRRVRKKDVEAIYLDYAVRYMDPTIVADTKSFAAMSQLRLLLMDGVTLKGDYKHFPKELKWLQCSLKELDLLPTSLHLENIVVLDLSYSSIVQFWDAPKMPVLEKLRVLKLKYCESLTMCPDFKSMPHLQILDCVGCEKMSELHPSIGHLESLINLNLQGCRSLKELPQEAWQLISLEELNLEYASQLTSLVSLCSLPQSMDSKSWEMPMLGKLRVLKLKGCKSLILSPDFRSMPHLQILDCEGCENICELHPSIGYLQSLINLNLQGCRSLKKLPNEVWQLTSIEELNLEGCSKIIIFQSPFGDSMSSQLSMLEKIKFLNLAECSSPIMFLNFMRMPHLEKLKLRKCEEIKELDPSIIHIKSLIELDLSWCGSLKELPQEIGQLTSLEQLDISYCHQISTLPESMGHLKQLKSLDLEGCSSLQSLPPLPPSLISLDVCYCDKLESIIDVSNVKGLQELDLSGCERLVDIPGIEQLKCLKALWLRGCIRLCESFLGRIMGLDGLTELDLRGCVQTTEVDPSISQLTSLESLDLSDCCQITALPSSIISLGKLLKLSVNNCNGLKFLPQLPPSLTTLNAECCTELERIEGVSFPEELRELDLTGCRKLVNIPDIVQFKGLRYLELGGCRSLEDSFLERLELDLHYLEVYSIPIRVIKGGSSYPQSLSFFIPKRSLNRNDQWMLDRHEDILLLGVDERSLNRIWWEVERKRPYRRLYRHQQGRSVVRLLFSTDDAQFSFSSFFEDRHLCWDKGIPTATVKVRRRELSSPPRMVKMHVSIDGCVLLHADFFSNKMDTDIEDYQPSDNIVKVKIRYD